MTGGSAYFDLGGGRYREKFGLAFEEVVPGMRIRHRPGVDVSQRDNHLDAVDTINNAHLHYDSHYAAQTEWKTPLSVSTMSVQRFFGLASRSWCRRRRILGIDSIALTAPLQGDDTLYAESEITGVEDSNDPDVGLVNLTLRGLSRDGRQIAKIVYQLEVYRQGRHPDDPAHAKLADGSRFASHHVDADGVWTEQTGLYFEDLRANETFEHWPSRRLSWEEVRLHALRSLEINPRWHDLSWLESTGQEPEVWEPLLIGAVTALTTRTFGRVVANLGWTDIALPAPMQPGQSLRAESTVIETRASGSRPDQGIATVDTRAYADETLVCSYRRALLIYRRGQGPYANAGY